MPGRFFPLLFGLTACCLSPTAARAAVTVLATSGFNDQTGLNSNPTANSPFHIGVTVMDQGVGEPGWDGPWKRLGGGDDRAPVSSEFVHEGDGAVKLFADQSVGTAFERPWFNIVPRVRVDAYVLVRPSASMRGHATFTTEGGEIINRTAAFWEIQNTGAIRVFNKASNAFLQTGFATLPNQWNKYSLILDSTTQTWIFLFNNQAFQPQAPLPFVNPTLFVDRVNMQAALTLTSYVDSIQISTAPLDSDYTEDGKVDVADLSVWTTNYGVVSTATHTQGDGNYNLHVDGGDFLAWQRGLGKTGISAVPEPATSVLAAIAMLLACKARRPRGCVLG